MAHVNVLRPLACLLQSSVKTSALVILNRPLENHLLKRLWALSVFKAVTDGGTNHLFSCADEERDSYIPDIITGDFDSAKSSVLEFYQQKSVPIIHTPDQDETDFTKCLRITIDKTQIFPVDQYLVMGSAGGRLDHQYANVNTLYVAAKLTNSPVYLISQGCLTCLLPPGKSVIKVDTGMEDNWCGLIPIGCQSHVTTSGLKWNMKEQLLVFGDRISSSNSYSDQQVTVETDQPLLWVMGYRSPEEV